MGFWNRLFSGASATPNIQTGYQIDSGPRKEINATAFFGQGEHLLFQFICETDSECTRKDFPLFERVISSLQIGAAGLRHPKVSLVGSSMCALCSQPLAGETTHSMPNLTLASLIPVCNNCRIAGSLS